MMKYLLVYLLVINRAYGMFKLGVLHHGDIHSHILPTRSSAGPCDPNTPYDCFGGVSRLTHAIRNFEKKERNLLHVNSGDYFEGSAFYDQFKWKSMFPFVVNMNLQATTLGRSDLRGGLDNLVPFLENLTVPILAANIDVSRSPRLEPYIQKSVVVFIGGKSVGIIGYISSKISVEGVKFKDEAFAVAAEAKRLTSNGVDILVGLGHGGYELDKTIASEVPELDIIVGGGSHTYLQSEKDTGLDKHSGRYPTVIRRFDGSKTLIVHAFAFTKYIGFLEVLFNKRGDILSWEGGPILLDNSIPNNLKTDRIIEDMKSKLDSKYEEILGKSHVVLEGTPQVCMRKECNLGNFVADAMLANAALDTYGECGWSEVNAALFPANTIQNSISIGNITLSTIIEAIPKEHKIVYVTLRGNILKRLMEITVTRYEETKPPEESLFMQMSGIRLTYDICALPGERVMDMSIRCSDCKIPKYQPINISKNYTIALVEELLLNEDQHQIISNNVIHIKQTNEKIVDVVAKYVRRLSPINTGLIDNIKFFTDGKSCFPFSWLIFK